MPANLTPQYLSAEQRFKEAASLPEKIERLEEMMAVIPKHKGTEKMRAELKRKMAKLREEQEHGKHGPSRAVGFYTVQREGAGQVVMVGAPNTGKSSLLAALTHAEPEIGEYPFTTRFPQPGMMLFENIKFQLVDMPPVLTRTYEPWIGGIVRGADLALLVVDLGSADVLDEVSDSLEAIGSSHIRLASREPAGLEEGAFFRPALLVANKADEPAAEENLPILCEFFGDRFEVLPVSTRSGQGLEELRSRIFRAIDVVRIFTKAPGKKVDLESAPFVLKRGSTVLDAARAVHRDFVNTLKFARVWSSERSARPAKHNGMMVDRRHVLEDEDILEFHV
jgi:hypothetical protein